MSFDAVVATHLTRVPNRHRFDSPMSKYARKLLAIMIEWQKLKPNILNKFAEIFDPIVYEETCHRYKVYNYATLLKEYKPKTEEEIMRALTLANLKDNDWLSRLEVSGHRVGLISKPRSAEVYRWLTTNFLMTDFNESDLNRIAELGEEKYSFELIKQEAAKILDPNKHNMQYLYAIIFDITEKGRIVDSRTEKLDKKYADKLSKLLATDSEPKQRFTFDGDEEDRWKRERQYLDILDNE